MVKSKMSIVWTDQAKLALKEVYKFHKKISVEWADKIRDKIYQSPEAVIIWCGKILAFCLFFREMEFR